MTPNLDFEDRVQTTRSRTIRAHDRLDASFFGDRFVKAHEAFALLEAQGHDIRQLGSIASVWAPPRFARSWAAPEEDGLPYLRPYDVLDYLPEATQRLAAGRNRGIDGLALSSGTILQTCSGRNLGPNTIVDRYLESYSLSHDMVRIDISDEIDRYYTLAYLGSSVGQTLLRRDRSGSVIDHISAQHVGAIMVPFLPDTDRLAIAETMRHGVELREQGRLELRTAVDSVSDGFKPYDKWVDWRISARDLGGRLDAAFHSPQVQTARSTAREAEDPPIGELASAFLPVRYKRYYVNSENGRPIVSGRQLLQPNPVNLRHISDRSFSDPAEYELRSGMTIFGAVGRSEGRQAWPALIGEDRDGWLASNDVMRLSPRDGVRPGAVWLGVVAARTQIQIKALSFGSVVDHMNPWDVEAVRVPAVLHRAATAVEEAWGKLSHSTVVIETANRMVDEALEQLGA